MITAARIVPAFPATVLRLVFVGLLAWAAPGCSDSPTATPPAVPVLASVSVTPTQGSLTALGATLQLQATARDTDGQAMSGVAFTWTSTDPGVAEVTAGGLVTAVTSGIVQIRAEAQGHGATATVTVTQEVAAIDVAPGSHDLVSLNETLQLSAEVRDANGFEVTGVGVDWSSTDPDVVAVDGTGLATAVGVGTADVIASAGGIEARSTLVVDPVPASLAFVSSPGQSRAGDPLAGTVEVAIHDALGSVVAGADLEVMVTLGAHAESGTLQGPAQDTAVSGVATFPGLTIDRAGTGYTLRATAGTLGAVESEPFDVGPCAEGTSALPRVLCVIDPSGDGPIDLTRFVMRFDEQGNYEVTLTADPRRPFAGAFRVNLNLYAPDVFAFFQDTFNDFDLVAPQTELVLTGVAPALAFWTPGTRVYLHSLDGTPNPPGTTLYRSGVSRLVQGEMVGEDILAFVKRPLPAVVN